MKKGCFIKIIFFVTILVAVIVYLIENNYTDLLLNPGKNIILTAIDNNWDEDFEYLKNSPEKDSLRTLLKFYIKELKSFGDINDERSEKFFDLFNGAIDDSIITVSELSELTYLIKKKLYEKPEINGN